MSLKHTVSGIAVTATLVAVGGVLLGVATTGMEDPDLDDRIAQPVDDDRPPVVAKASSTEDGPDEQEQTEQRLAAPAAPRFRVRLPSHTKDRYQALALYFRSSIFAQPSKAYDVIGIARRGARIPSSGRVNGSGCDKGRWYKVQGGGYACTSRGFLVKSKPGKLRLHHSLPNLKKLLPHRYGKVKRKGAERLFRIPTVEEDKLIAKAASRDGGWPEVVEKSMKGIYFIAIDHEEKSKGRAFYCTVRGRYVRKEDVDLRTPPPMRGRRLGKRDKLPLAFVFDEDRPLYELREGKLRRVGVAEKHARFRPRVTITHGKRRLLQTPRGLYVDRDHVRLARAVKRPEEIGKGSRWIHVDLSQQTLVAYEGDRPVFATLVSSGKSGFEPPIGVFQIHKKYISTTMNGPDPDDGWYEVEEVPWTMYYWESYALHGTYWHNDFGKSRSHGCTNIAPADAKWLFYWTEPKVPYGWHAREDKGTKVYFTRS
jgi:hypothetical protein